MPKATLIIDGDTSALRRALGEIPGITQRVQSVMTGATRRGSSERTSIERASAREQESIALRLARAKERLSKAETQKEAAEARKRVQADAAFARERDSIHARLARAREARARQETTREAQENRQRVRDDERASRERDRTHAREVANRTRRERAAVREMAQGTRTAGRIVGAVAGAAGGYATNMNGQVQDARGRRAAPERAVGNAIYQAGGNRTETTAALRRVTQFAQTNGIPAAELAAALQGAQTEQSVLGNRGEGNAGTRDSALTAFLENARLARNTGNSVSETTRLAGLFASQGFDATLQRQLLLYTGGATQRGAVEMGDVTRGAMPAITARMGSAMSRARLAPGSNEDSIRSAGMAEYRQALAEIEVARGTQGASPREAGNAMRNVSTALQSRVTQDKLLNNIRANQGRGSALEARLFEADPTRRGHQRLRAPMTNALNLVGAFQQSGMTSTQFQNITGGGGAGNPLSMLSNQRRLLGGLLDTNAQGVSGADKVREIMNPNVALTEADVNRGAEIFSNDTTAQLAANEEANTNALRDLHPDLVSVSDSITGWKMRNPWMAEGAEQGRNAAGGVMDALTTGGTAGGVGSVLTRLLGGGTAAGGGAGAAGLGATLTGTVGAAGLATTAAAVLASAGAGLAIGGQINSAMGHTQQSDNPFNAAFYTEFARSVRDAVRDGITSTPVTATVSPHDVAQAVSSSTPGRRRPGDS